MNELYQEIVLEHAKHPRNFGVPGWAWRHLEDKCQCNISGCDGKYWLYYVLDSIEDGYSLKPYFGTQCHVKYWSGEEIYGPYPISHRV